MFLMKTPDDLVIYPKLQRNISNGVSFKCNGYSFSDLRAAVNTIKSADLSSLSSYISINNITNDKEQLITYYEYRTEQVGT